MLQRSKQRSGWSGLVLTAAVVSATWLPGQVLAQETAPAAPAPAAAESQPGAAVNPNGTLKQYADDFLHYSLVNNAELAKANAQAILNANAQPADLLAAFEQAANGRNPREIMLRNEKREDLREVSAQLLDKLEEGYRAVSRDPQRIRAEVARLTDGPRAYNNARDRLMAAGAYGAPIFLETLQDGSKKAAQPFVLRVMTEIGRPLLPPLLEELKTKDNALKLLLVEVIGQIGYPQALPDLRLLQADNSTDAEVKRAVDQAIGRIDRTGGAARSSPAELYLAAGRNYYTQKASYQPGSPDEKTNAVWNFDSGLNNVVPIDVPTPIWNSVMAMRCAESALKLEANNSGAISLWLASSLRKEINLPQGATDPTRVGGKPDAAFYALAAGPIYVNPVLSQALADRDTALALKAIDALESTGGKEGLISGNDAPLIRALNDSDRSVRLRAAFALARANPATAFPASFRVVPTLAEAIGGGGGSTVLVVSPDENTRNKIADALRTNDPAYTVFSAATFSDALQQSRSSPSIAAAIVPFGAEANAVGSFRDQDTRLGHTAVIVMATPEQAQGASAGAQVIDPAADADTVKAALAKVTGGTGGAAAGGDDAGKVTATALDLLKSLAADHKSIYNVNDALPALTAALRDKNAAVAGGAAGVIGHLNSPEGQKALATAALSPDTDAALRAPFFLALAESAKRTGNALDSAAVNSLIKVVSTESDAPTKEAAATALGALNVPSNQASTLILQQVK
jgi:HEAT repeat protein